MDADRCRRLSVQTQAHWGARSECPPSIEEVIIKHRQEVLGILGGHSAYDAPLRGQLQYKEDESFRVPRILLIPLPRYSWRTRSSTWIR